MVLLNPYQTTKFREMDTMKYVKNDNIDSQMIAALLKSGRYSEAYVSEELYQSIKSLYRHKATLMQEIKSAKRQLSTTLVIVFPEFEQIIKDPFSVSGMALLEKYPTAKHYKGASADRILKDGHVINKIGTYTIAVLAKTHGIPFYVAAPTSTIDPHVDNGALIPIEERDEDEIHYVRGEYDGKIVSIRITPTNSRAKNPVFDVTPVRLIDGVNLRIVVIIDYVTS